MADYRNINCPICEKTLENGEEIAICPECGAPYHKKCIIEHGECVYQELHLQGESWKNKNEINNTSSDYFKCAQCGFINSDTSIFCSKCGMKLGEKNNNQPNNAPPFYSGNEYNNQYSNQTQNTNQSGQFNPYTNGGMYPPPNPFMPFGANIPNQDPDEEIDKGITAKEYSAVIGRNTYYFLPRFKMMVKNKSKTMNWSAFLFQGWYFLYRKMYALGILIIVADMLLSLPSAIITVNSMTATNSMISAAQNEASGPLMIAYTICSMLQFGFRILCGFIANSMYKKRCDGVIEKTKALSLPKDKYYEILTKKGSVATKLILGLLIAYLAMSVGLFFFSMFM